jgi:hypothetical protein
VLAGGKADPGPKQDYGFMYGRTFEDLDGHVLELLWMDVEAANGRDGPLADRSGVNASLENGA